MAERGRTWLPHRRLVVVCAGANALAAGLTLAFGPAENATLAPQAAAPPPLGLFFDLRWLLVDARSWLTFSLGAAALVVLRSLVSAWQASLAWPGRPPSFASLALRAVAFNLLTGLLLFPFALLLFALGAFSLSWLYLAAVPAALVVAALVHAGGLSRRWWRELPAPGALGWMLLSMLVVTVAAGLVALDPVVLAVPLSALTGVFEAVAWVHIVTAVVARPTRHFVPAVPALLATFLVGAVIGAAVGFHVARPHRIEAASPTLPALSHRQVVLFVGGYASHWHGGAPALPGVPTGAVVVPFSYRGATADGLPEPYAAAATRAGVGPLSALMARQVARLDAASGRALDIVAVSEGSVVTSAFLARTGRPAVDRVVLVSPVLDPGEVGYPPPGEEGPGFVASEGLALMSSWLHPISGLDLAPQQPFLRSLDRSGVPSGRPCRETGCTVGGELEIAPLADALCGQLVANAGLESVVVADFHGGNFTDPAVRQLLARALAGRRVSGDAMSLRLDHLIADVAGAWRVPTTDES